MPRAPSIPRSRRGPRSTAVITRKPRAAETGGDGAGISEAASSWGCLRCRARGVAGAARSISNLPIGPARRRSIPASAARPAVGEFPAANDAYRLAAGLAPRGSPIQTGWESSFFRAQPRRGREVVRGRWRPTRRGSRRSSTLPAISIRTRRRDESISTLSLDRESSRRTCVGGWSSIRRSRGGQGVHCEGKAINRSVRYARVERDHASSRIGRKTSRPKLPRRSRSIRASVTPTAWPATWPHRIIASGRRCAE